MPSPSLRAERVSFSFGERTLLDDVTFHLERGWTGLVGANGSGKSTLLRLLAGELQPTAGAIRRERGVVLCPQEVESLDEHVRSIADAHDGLARRLHGQLLLDADALARWETLSPGERKRWQIAAALWREPAVLLLDEPTNHLDSEASALLRQALGAFRGVGVLVSHDRALLDAVTTATLRLRNGDARLWPGPFSAAHDAWTAEERSTREEQRELKRRLEGEARRLDDARRRLSASSRQRSTGARMKGPADSDARTLGADFRAEMAERAHAAALRRSIASSERVRERLESIEVSDEPGRELFLRYEPCPRAVVLRFSGDVRHSGTSADHAAVSSEPNVVDTVKQSPVASAALSEVEERRRPVGPSTSLGGEVVAGVVPHTCSGASDDAGTRGADDARAGASGADDAAILHASPSGEEQCHQRHSSLSGAHDAALRLRSGTSGADAALLRSETHGASDAALLRPGTRGAHDAALRLRSGTSGDAGTRGAHDAALRLRSGTSDADDDALLRSGTRGASDAALLRPGTRGADDAALLRSGMRRADDAETRGADDAALLRSETRGAHDAALLRSGTRGADDAALLRSETRGAYDAALRLRSGMSGADDAGTRGAHDAALRLRPGTSGADDAALLRSRGADDARARTSGAEGAARLRSGMGDDDVLRSESRGADDAALRLRSGTSGADDAGTRGADDAALRLRSGMSGADNAALLRSRGADDAVPHSATSGVLLRGVSLALRRDEHVVVEGKNGAGKSTLLRALVDAAALPPERVLSLPQELSSDETQADLALLRELPAHERGRVLQLVHALGVEPDHLLATTRPSPGEARKLRLALGLGRNAWLAVLDEPTNHLDLPSIEHLERALAAFPGALLVVTHDAVLAQRVATTRWLVADGTVRTSTST